MGRRYSTGRTYCHHCWNMGHNVKTCPKLTEEVKANVNGYYHSRYAKYFDEGGNRKHPSSVKNCSYCKEPGHTKRTCSLRAEDAAANVQTNIKYRQSVWNWMKKNELGVGSLVTTYDNNMYLVTGINWDDFVCGDGNWNRRHLSLHSVDKGVFQSFIVEDEIMRGSRYFKDHLKVDCGVMPQKPPAQWFAGNSEFYKDFKGRVYNVLDD